MNRVSHPLEDAMELYNRLNRVRRLIVKEVTLRGGKDLPELVIAERELAVQFEYATLSLGGVC